MTTFDLSSALYTAPANIALAAENVRLAHEDMRKASQQGNIARAKATIKNQGAKNQAILQAQVELDEDVVLWESKLGEYIGKLEVAKIKLKQEEDTFISARKLASLSDEERRYQSDSYTPRK